MKTFVYALLALQLAVLSTTVFADNRFDRDSGRSRDRDDRRPQHQNNVERNDRDRHERSFSQRYRRDTDNNVSVNLLFGASPYRRPYSYPSRVYSNYGIGYGVGYNSVGWQYSDNYNYSYSPWSYSNQRPIIVEHNTYIEQPSYRSNVTTYSNRPSETSLLRDLNGRCFERHTDNDGYETRTELPASECNF